MVEVALTDEQVALARRALKYLACRCEEPADASDMMQLVEELDKAQAENARAEAHRNRVWTQEEYDAATAEARKWSSR